MKPFTSDFLTDQKIIVFGSEIRIMEVIKIEYDKIAKTFFYRVAYKEKIGRKIHKMWFTHKHILLGLSKYLETEVAYGKR